MSKFLQKGFFLLRFRIIKRITSSIRIFTYSIQGMQVGGGTFLSKIYTTWPHQVAIGKYCTLEHFVHLKYDGIWKEGRSIVIKDNVFIGSGCELNIRAGIVIGSDCLIASGCKFIDHDHGTSTEFLMNKQEGPEARIEIGNNVWLGCNVIILKGVQIGEGAVVAAGAVVTKSIPGNEIWAGVPAKRIGNRIK